MLRFQDPLSTWGSGSTSRANMVLAQNGWLSVGAGWSCTNANTSAPGGWCLGIASGASDWSPCVLSLGGDVTTFGVGVRLWVGKLPTTTRTLLAFRTATNVLQFYLSINPDGSIQAANDSAIIGTSAAGQMTPASFIHVELKATIAASGDLEVRVNKRVALNLTSVRTRNSGTSINTAQYVQMMEQTSGTTDLGACYIATPIVWDTTGSFCNDFLGPKIPYLVQLTSDGTPTDWDVVGGAGSSFGTVDNIPQNGASQYLEATADGDVTKMNFEAKSLSNVVALTIQHTDRLATAGGSMMTVSLTDGGSETAGEDRNPAYPAWTAYQDTFYEDPAGSGAGSLTAPLAAGDLGVKLERTV